MATIENSNIIRKIIDECKLSAGYDNVPNQLGNMVSPVFVVNEEGKTLYITQLVSNNTIDITVPTGKKWRIISIRATFTTSATAGNRLFNLIIYPNSSKVVSYWNIKEQVQAASVAETYMFSESLFMGHAYTGQHTMPLPQGLILDEGFIVTLKDATNTDAAGDTINVQMVVKEYSTGVL